MIKIDYTDCRPSIKIEKGQELIFCIVRKKWLVITPEEWVRQNILCHLVNHLKYPVSLIGVEKQLAFGELKKRFDIVVYRNERPFIVIECKEMRETLNQAVLSQVLRYNMMLNADYFFISNGLSCYGFRISNSTLEEVNAFPGY
jgi:hypothetical protein